MKELNKLTQRLFREGWTETKHPDYVKDWGYASPFYGGYEYTPEKQMGMVFTTPCGLLVPGSHWSSGYMSFKGIDWTLENDNPTVNCPYRRIGCADNHPELRFEGVGEGLSKMVFCACRETAQNYDYNKSMEKVLDERDHWKEAMYQKFSQGKAVCREQCHFDEHTNTWEQRYDPLLCARIRDCTFCTILNKELSTKKSNIFYDLKTSTSGMERGLFTKEFEIHIEKGIRLLDRNASLDICNAILTTIPNCAQRQAESKYSNQSFWAEHQGKFFQVEAINLRVEVRASHDLKQDIEDLRKGYTVAHTSDLAEASRQAKRQRRELALQSRVRKVKKRILLYGMDGLENSDRFRVNRMIERGILSRDEIEQLNKQRKEEKNIEQLAFL